MSKRVSLLGHGKSETPAGSKLFFTTSPGGLNKNISAEKVANKKALFSLPADVLDSLDEVWLDLRSKKKRIDKSSIVALAIKWIINNYKNNKDDNIISKSEPERKPFVPLR